MRRGRSSARARVALRADRSRSREEIVQELHARIAGNLRQLAERQGIPLSHLPDHAGVGRSHFWEVLAGRKSPTLAWLVRVATALDVDIGELLRR